MKPLYGPKKGGFDAPTALMVLCGAAVFALLIGWYLYAKTSRIELDPKTLCPTEGSHGRSIVLLDTSDPLSAKQQERLNKLLEAFRDPRLSADAGQDKWLKSGPRYVEPHHELVFYTLEVDPAEAKPLLRICNPGNPKEMEFKDELTKGVAIAKARWRDFDKAVTNVFPKELTERTQPFSLILETLSLLIEREAPSAALRDRADAMSVRLFIISDMIQHSDNLSHFQELPEWSDLEKRSKFPLMSTNLRKIDVFITYLRRPRYARVQTIDHFNWWRRAISKMGGSLRHLDPV